MLGSDVHSVRLGGVYALHRLAEEHPEQYHLQIMRLFCAFARNPTPGKNMQDDLNAKVREDIQATMDAIAYRSDQQLQIELDNVITFDLRDVKLTLVGLVNANLHLASFPYSNLAHSQMKRANLSGVVFFKADLYRADLTEADLSGAILTGANLDKSVLTGTKFSSVAGVLPAKGLTQSQLDDARADPNNPPKLEGVDDAETGKPLVWQGRPLRDDVDGDR